MKTSQPNDRGYQRIEDMLTPRHTPQCKLTFTPPQQGKASGKPRRIMRYILRIAAILIVGIGIGYGLRTDHTATAAQKSAEVGISKFFSSEECRVYFDVRLKDPADIRFKLSPAGNLVPASLLWQKEKKLITLRWRSGAGEQKILFSPDSITGYTDGKIVKTQRTTSGSDMLEIFDMSADELLALIDAKTTSMVRKPDMIIITASSHDEKTELTISEPDGRIQSLTLTDPKSGRLMLRTTSITY